MVSRGTRTAKVGRALPWALALGMVGLVVASVLGASSAPASALPAPSQYSTPPPPYNPVTDPLVVIGLSLAVLVLVLGVILVLRSRQRRGPPPEAIGPTLSPEAFGATGGGESFAASSDAVKD